MIYLGRVLVLGIFGWMLEINQKFVFAVANGMGFSSIKISNEIVIANTTSQTTTTGIAVKNLKFIQLEANYRWPNP